MTLSEAITCHFGSNTKIKTKTPVSGGDINEAYNLYHLLNHLNLFGGSYLGGVLRILRYYV